MSDSHAERLGLLIERLRHEDFEQAREALDALVAETQRVKSLEYVLSRIAEPSYIGSRSDAEAVAIYRAWAENALGR